MSVAQRTVSLTPTLLDQLGELPPRRQAQVLAKTAGLATDPESDAKTREGLRGVETGLCRLRSGDGRVYYAYDGGSVSVFSVRRRSDDTYDALPVVAVAGFVGTPYPARSETDAEVASDALIRERRTLFVAMTRAMRALLMVTPEGHDSMLFDGFDPELWNVEES